MKTTSIQLVLLATTLWFAITHNIQASPPLVSYQGTVNGTNGNPLNGAYDVSFLIYDSAEGGNAVWGPELKSQVPFVNGYFNVILGPQDVDNRPLSGVFSDSDERYIAIQVGQVVISPRQRFLSNPYAYAASSVSNQNYVLSHSRFEVKGSNFLEFGAGTVKGVNNGIMQYGKWTSGLEIVGGGTDAPSRLLTLYGGLEVINPAGGGADLHVDRNATVDNILTVREIRAPDVDTGVTPQQLNAMVALLGDDAAPVTLEVKDPADLQTWKSATASAFDLAPFLNDDDGCRIRIYLQHEDRSDDKVLNYEILLFAERPGFVIGNSGKGAGISGHTAWHYNQWNWGFGDGRRDTIFEAPDNWAFITDYKNAEINNGTHGSEEANYKVWFFTHPKVSARFIVYDH